MLAIFLTMFIGGVWHGAGWTFVLWGILHGVYLIINHLWRAHGPAWQGRLWRIGAHLLTFACVVAGWVLFRAEHVGAAGSLLQSMIGVNQDRLKPGDDLLIHASEGGVYWVIGSYIVCLLLPSTMEYFRLARDKKLHSRIFTRLKFRPRLATALGLAALFTVCIASMGKISEFLYFQF